VETSFTSSVSVVGQIEPLLPATPAHAGETFLKMGKAKFIATREIVIEFVF
jgi:hypothetical protein